MEDLYTTLLEIQELDQQIDESQARIAQIDERLAGMDAPAQALEREVEALQGRLAEMRKEQRKLERGADEKREALRKYEERLERVRTAREEAAAKTELDLVRRAAEADERDALDMMEQVTRVDLKVDDVQRKLDAARQEAKPQREELEAERKEAEDALAVLRDRRENQALRLPAGTRQLYERLRSGRTKRALAKLLPDGACGFCYSMIPIQQQSEIRRGGTLTRCEACGLILYAGEP